MNMNYESLLIEADKNKLITKEKPLKAYDGRISQNKIAIRNTLTLTQKNCVLAEELGHYYTSTGNILNQDNIENRKQEYKARLWAYDKVVGLMGLVNAYKSGCRNRHEVVDYLNIDEKFLADAIECYKSKYGVFTILDTYIIYFEPCVAIVEIY